MPQSTNQRLRRSISYGGWVRTKLPPYRAVKWVTALREDGRERLNGRRWEEILPVGVDREPETFFAEAVTAAPPTEALGYAPKADEPICGWWLAQEGPNGQLTHAHDYCPRPVPAGALCAKHEAEFHRPPQGESNDH